MKNIFKIIFTLYFILTTYYLTNAQVGINDNNASPDASAMLDVKSTTKGMLIPRMTTTERNAVSSPAEGLMIYNTTTDAFNFYNGAAWIEIKSGRTKTIADADNDTKIQVEEGADEDSIRFDIKGTERLVLRQNNHNMTMFNLPNNNYNIFIGQDAGLNTQLGSGDQGKYNQFIGYLAGHKNTTGNKNLFLGTRAGYSNTTGVINTFIGFDAGKGNTTGSFNFFLGEGAGRVNSTGSSNFFLGGGAGQSNTTASNNLFIGGGAGTSTTTGGNNLFIGQFAGASNTTGTGNIFLGYNAGMNETGSNKLYIDNSNTNTPLIYGEFDNNKVAINGSFQVDNNSARVADFNATNAGGAYIEVNNSTGTRALFGPDSVGFTAGSTSDVVIGNFSNGAFGLYANATEKISISKYGLVEIKDTLKIVDGSQGAGKVLTSDANGVATWTTLDVALPDTAQPVKIEYHGYYIYVHPTDNASGLDWATAKTTCANLTAFGKSDWYLPTRLELDAMYKQSFRLAGLSQTEIVKYWSSTVKDANNAYTQRLDYGGPDPDAKTDTSGHNCRCVRKD